jgi:hypothetical protein
MAKLIPAIAILLAGFMLVTGVTAASDASGGNPAMNSLMVIHPYKFGGMWVFDDEKAGLVKEPFVAGTDVIIDKMVAGLDRPEEGFTLIFSANPFPGHQAVFEWRRADMGGHWYHSPQLNAEGWLCPAMFKYFDKAPPRIYAQFKSKKS